jgi:hypothetical protein
MCADAPAIPRDAISSIVSELVAKGLLRSKSSFMGAVREAPIEQPNPVRITDVSIVTHDRVDAILPCLRSYNANAYGHGRTPHFIVSNDSNNPETDRVYFEVLECAKNETGASVSYIGTAEKRSYIAVLAREAAIDPALLNFALLDPENCGYTVGANRNALAIATAGRAMLSVDDDTRCEIAKIPGADDGLDLVSKGNPTHVTYFHDHAAAMRSASFLNEDMLAMHEALLGKSVGNLIAAKPAGGISLDQSSPAFLRRLETGNGTVRVSWAGILGDSGWGQPTFALSEEGAGREALLKNKEHYRTSYCSRQILRGVRRATISDGTYCQSTFVAFDHRSCLPPFMPVLRGEDILYGMTLRTCHPDAYIGYVPRALLHTPFKARRHAPDDIWKTAGPVSLCCVVLGFVPHQVAPGSSDEDRLRTLGSRLIEAASITPSDFRERLHVNGLISIAKSILSLEQLLKAHGGKPDFCANDVRRHIGTLRAQLTDPKSFLPTDLLQSHPVENVIEVTQRLILKFGQLLRVWPDIIAASKSLQKKEVTLSHSI